MDPELVSCVRLVVSDLQISVAELGCASSGPGALRVLGVLAVGGHGLTWLE